jgi:hypothetical protein
LEYPTNLIRWNVQRVEFKEVVMTTPFGPQLVGETEKTLNALLRTCLEPEGLTEPQWVALRLAGQLGGSVNIESLVGAIADRAHFANSAELVGELSSRGLLEDGRLSTSGDELTAAIQARIGTLTAGIWENLPDSDVDSTTRVLNELITRGRRALASAK